MILERSMSDGWLSNTYLVAAGPGTDAFFVDAGGPVEPLIAKADEHDLNVTHILLTHHHGDHVSDLGKLKERYPDAEVLIHPEERGEVPGATGDLLPGQELEIGGLPGQAPHTPRPTPGVLFLPARARPHRRDALAAGRRHRRLHRRHAVQGLGRRCPRAGLDRLRRPQALDH